MEIRLKTDVTSNDVASSDVTSNDVMQQQLLMLWSNTGDVTSTNWPNVY